MASFNLYLLNNEVIYHKGKGLSNPVGSMSQPSKKLKTLMKILAVMDELMKTESCVELNSHHIGCFCRPFEHASKAWLRRVEASVFNSLAKVPAVVQVNFF